MLRIGPKDKVAISKSVQLVVFDASHDGDGKRLSGLIETLRFTQSVHSLWLITAGVTPTLEQWKSIGESITNLKWQHETKKTSDLRSFGASLVPIKLISGDPRSASRRTWPYLSCLELDIAAETYDTADVTFVEECFDLRGDKHPIRYLLAGSMPLLRPLKSVLFKGECFSTTTGHAFEKIVLTPQSDLNVVVVAAATAPAPSDQQKFTQTALEESMRMVIDSRSGVPTFPQGGILLFQTPDSSSSSSSSWDVFQKHDSDRFFNAIHVVKPIRKRIDTSDSMRACATIMIPAKTRLDGFASRTVSEPSETEPLCIESHGTEGDPSNPDIHVFVCEYPPHHTKQSLVRETIGAASMNHHQHFMSLPLLCLKTCDVMKYPQMWWHYVVERRAYSVLGDGDTVPRFDAQRSSYSVSTCRAHIVWEFMGDDFILLSSLRELPLRPLAREMIATAVATSLCILHKRGWNHNAIDADSVLYNPTTNHVLFINLQNALPHSELSATYTLNTFEHHDGTVNIVPEHLYDVFDMVQLLKTLDAKQISDTRDPSSFWRLFLAAYERMATEAQRSLLWTLDLFEGKLSNNHKTIVEFYIARQLPRISHVIPSYMRMSSSETKEHKFSSSIAEMFAQSAAETVFESFVRPAEGVYASAISRAVREEVSSTILRPLAKPPVVDVYGVSRIFEAALHGCLSVRHLTSSTPNGVVSRKFTIPLKERVMTRLVGTDRGQLLAMVRALSHLSGIQGVEGFCTMSKGIDEKNGVMVTQVNTERPRGKSLSEISKWLKKNQLSFSLPYCYFLGESLVCLLRNVHRRGIAHNNLTFDVIYLNPETHTLTIVDWRFSTCRSEQDRLCGAGIIPTPIMSSEQADGYALAVEFFRNDMPATARALIEYATKEWPAPIPKASLEKRWNEYHRDAYREQFRKHLLGRIAEDIKNKFTEKRILEVAVDMSVPILVGPPPPRNHEEKLLMTIISKHLTDDKTVGVYASWHQAYANAVSHWKRFFSKKRQLDEQGIVEILG